MISIEYGVSGFHRSPLNFFSLTLSAIAFQVFFMSPLNLCAFLFSWVQCQATVQLVCRLYLRGHLSLLLRSACIALPWAPDSGGSQGSISSSLSAPTAPLLVIQLPEQESISFGVPSGSNSNVIIYNHDSESMSWEVLNLIHFSVMENEMEW